MVSKTVRAFFISKFQWYWIVARIRPDNLNFIQETNLTSFLVCEYFRILSSSTELEDWSKTAVKAAKCLNCSKLLVHLWSICQSGRHNLCHCALWCHDFMRSDKYSCEKFYVADVFKSLVFCRAVRAGKRFKNWFYLRMCCSSRICTHFNPFSAWEFQTRLF